MPQLRNDAYIDMKELLQFISDVEGWDLEFTSTGSEIVCNANFDKIELQRIAVELKSKFPGLGIYEGEIKNTENQSKYKMRVKCEDILIFLDTLKHRQQQDIRKALAAATKNLDPAEHGAGFLGSVKSYFLKTFKERKGLHQEFLRDIEGQIIAYEKAFTASSEQQESFTRLVQAISEIELTKEYIGRVSAAPSQRASNISRQSDSLRNGRSTTVKKPVSSSVASGETKTESKPSKLLNDKVQFLSDLLNGIFGPSISDNSWNDKGRNCFGFWRNAPDGIRKLRETLKDFSAVNTSDETTVNSLFNRVAGIFESKQKPYRGLGDRKPATQAFYKSGHEKINTILGVIKLDMDENAPLLPGNDF